MTDPAKTDAPAPVPPPALRWFWIPLAAILVLDLVTKSWVFSMNGIPHRRPDTWFALTQDVNEGVAWSMGSSQPKLIAILTLLLVPVLFVVFFRHFRRQGRFENLIFGCVLGGAVGNAVDRIAAQWGWFSFPDGAPVRGVRDFLSFNLGFPCFNPFPTFNVADIGITIGFLGLTAVAWRKPRTGPAKPSAPFTSGQPSD